MPIVSIVVPAYNAQKYLNRCVESILNQSFKDFELILVDDGSSDSTGKICDVFAENDSRVKVIHKKNGGVSSARNAGIDKASGELIMFVDSDDYISENMLSDMLCRFTKDTDMVVSSIKMVTESKAFLYCMKSTMLSTKDLLEDYCNLVFPRICISGPCAKLYKKEIIYRHGVYFDSTMNLGEDTAFNMSYLKYCSKIISIDEPHYFYMRENENSLYSKFRDYWYCDIVKVYELVLDVLKEFECSEEAIQNYIASHISNLIGTLVQAIRTADMKSCISYMKQLSKNKALKDNISSLKKGSIVYYTVRAIQLKLYYIVYFLLCIKYRGKNK